MDERDDAEGRRKILELIGGIDYALFTTFGRDGAPLNARPMAYRKAEDDGDLWFFTKRGSRKLQDIEADARTLVSFSDVKNQSFVSITGRSTMVADRAKVKALWSEIYRAWFPGGPDDDSVVLIRVEAEHAEYWDTPTSTAVYVYGYLKAVATGQPSRAGEIGAVDLR